MVVQRGQQRPPQLSRPKLLQEIIVVPAVSSIPIVEIWQPWLKLKFSFQGSHPELVLHGFINRLAVLLGVQRRPGFSAQRHYRALPHQKV